jgi:8-oxo-dGTP pyrophosphatase MutT (NUDIX family)
VRLSLTTLQRRIAERLRGLPGPETWPGSSPALTTGEPRPEWAAVAVILAPEPDSVLLIRRAERSDDPWSGHVGLPGGRLDPADPDLRSTAIRETAEEVGYLLPPGGFLGVLDDVWPRTPLPRLIVVRPFVFALSSRPAVSLSDEVADAFWIPLSELRRPEVYRETVIPVRGRELAFPAYHLEQGMIWGLTERILTPLLALA